MKGCHGAHAYTIDGNWEWVLWDLEYEYGTWERAVLVTSEEMIQFRVHIFLYYDEGEYLYHMQPGSAKKC